MKKLKILSICIVCIAMLSVVRPSVAMAQISIAVVDIEEILATSKAAKDARRQIAAKRESFVKTVQDEEIALRENHQKIEEQRTSLSKEDFMSEIKDFEEQRIEARKALQKRKAALEDSYAAAMKTLTDTIFDVCQGIANENKIDLVITRQNIIVGNSALDITSEVLSRLDKTLPRLKIKE